MGAATEKDYRKRPCPVCGEVGQVHFIYTSSTFGCRACGTTGIDPYKEQAAKAAPTIQPKAAATPKPKVVKIVDVVADSRPLVPTGAGVADIVVDYLDDAKKQVTSKVYCPRINTISGEEFDPDSPQARFIMKIYGPRFKNRRRYNRDLAKRKEQHGTTAQD